jgi:heptosyltransferase-3
VGLTEALAEPWAASGSIQRRGNVWLIQNPLPCMPCMLEGCERHIASRSACLDELPPEQVLAAIDQVLEAFPRKAAMPISA